MPAALQSQRLDHAPSFDRVYAAHHAYVGASLRRLGVAERDVDDVTQEVFVVVHRRLPSFEGRSALRTWLYAIALRVAANYKRKRRDVATDLPDLVATHSDPEMFAAHREASELLFGLLDGLDADKRTVFVLSELRGMTAPEIARITGANTRTVYSRLRAAKDRFSAGLRRVHARETNLMARTRPKPARFAAVLGWLGLTPKAAAWSGAALAVALGTVVAVAPRDSPAPASVVEGTSPGGRSALASGAPSAADGSRLVRTARSEPTPARAVPMPDSGAPSLSASGVRSNEHRPAPAAAEASGTSPTEDPADSSPQVAGDRPTAPARSSAAQNLELQLLADARKRLQQDPTGALELLDEHLAKFPNSALARERRQTRLTALCRTKRRAQARGLATSWSMKPPC